MCGNGRSEEEEEGNLKREKAHIVVVFLDNGFIKASSFFELCLLWNITTAALPEHSYQHANFSFVAPSSEELYTRNKDK